jgi:hypothetical protein
VWVNFLPIHFVSNPNLYKWQLNRFTRSRTFSQCVAIFPFHRSGISVYAPRYTRWWPLGRYAPVRLVRSLYAAPTQPLRSPLAAPRNPPAPSTIGGFWLLHTGGISVVAVQDTDSSTQPCRKVPIHRPAERTRIINTALYNPLHQHDFPPV